MRTRSTITILCVASITACATAGGKAPPCDPAVVERMSADTMQLIDGPGTESIGDSVTRRPPRLRNTAAAERALEQEYPPYLRDAGIGGVVAVWVFVDEHGEVQRSSLASSAGRREFDTAALRVAESLRFLPATFGECAVPVWVAFPITFSVG